VSERPVTLVTGSRTGIGRALAERFLAQGHAVIGCSRGETDLSHPSYRHHRLDVSDESAVQEMIRRTRSEFGRLHHLVNNAGTASMNHFLLTPTSVARKILDTNVLGPFIVCREAARLMQAARFGRIVNFTTVAVELELEGEALYAASKAALSTMTRILARELGEWGITVNSVGPAPVETDLTRGVPREKLEAVLERQAIRRYASFDDVANVVEFFLRKESAFVTGQNIYLGGV
jgi:3-oxoacyl-[acyl-carrier protein] reductase